jgi:HAMP domain-containing protein
MQRHRRTVVVLVASVVAFAAGCSGSSEKKLLGDFFRASRLRDSLTLGNFATATFDPRTDGVVESFDVTKVGDERVTPLPLKQYVKAIEDAKSADTDATTRRREFYNANVAAISRFAKLDGDGKPVPAKDQPLKATWDKWVTEGNERRKAVSDATRQLNESRGLAELSLSRPNGAMVDATKYDAVEMMSKEVLLTASVRPPSGEPTSKNLKAVLKRARVKDEKGKEINGRWIVAWIGPA